VKAAESMRGMVIAVAVNLTKLVLVLVLVLVGTDEEITMRRGPGGTLLRMYPSRRWA
jgi:hypothetical protein